MVFASEMGGENVAKAHRELYSRKQKDAVRHMRQSQLRSFKETGSVFSAGARGGIGNSNGPVMALPESDW